MSKIDNLTRLKHIRDATKEALFFVENKTRQDLGLLLIEVEKAIEDLEN